jgi:TPR repeat protein
MLTECEQEEFDRYYHEKAEKSITKFPSRLGEIYEFGKSVIGDYELAAFWHQKAVESGQPYLYQQWVLKPNCGFRRVVNLFKVEIVVC